MTGDMTGKTRIREHIQKCDVILPLVAVATPALYVQDPCVCLNWILKPILKLCACVLNIISV